MNLDDRRIWQVAAGDTNRSYGQLFTDWNVIAIGPGVDGPWPECEKKLRERLTARKIGDIRRFYEIADGDIVVLRIGTKMVLAVGIAEGPTSHTEAFGDVDGWDLQHVRRVRWLWRRPDNFEFPTAYTLDWGQTVTQGLKPAAKEWLHALDLTEPTNPPLPDLPSPSPKINDEDLEAYFADDGFDTQTIHRLVQARTDVLSRHSWYDEVKHEPSEYETIAYLVLPLLKALGWPETHTAIEWCRIDVALFDTTIDASDALRHNANLVAAIEVKRLNYSCLTAREQAATYAQQAGRECCHRLIVTDGLRYAVHVRDEEGHFSYYPTAYLNLARLRDQYPIMRCQGARTALRLMRPEWGNRKAIR